MLNLCLVLILSASVFSESVRETETWVPMKSTQAVAMAPHSEGLEASGDFGFTDDDEDEDDYDDGSDDYNYDDEDDEEFSGSGDGATTVSPGRDSTTSTKPNLQDNRIPDHASVPVRPTVNERDFVNRNEIPRLGNQPTPSNENPPNVLMAHATDESFFSRTEVLAALIAGSAVGLMFAVLLILLLVYRMKKKDEGSYDLGKKPIYKKAPTTEIYA